MDLSSSTNAPPGYHGPSPHPILPLPVTLPPPEAPPALGGPDGGCVRVEACGFEDERLEIGAGARIGTEAELREQGGATLVQVVGELGDEAVLAAGDIAHLAAEELTEVDEPPGETTASTEATVGAVAGGARTKGCALAALSGVFCGLLAATRVSGGARAGHHVDKLHGSRVGA